jgi:hypothetical protein
MKTCRSGDIVPPFLTSALDGGEWPASGPRSFTPGERATVTHWIGGWVGPRTGVEGNIYCRELNPDCPACNPSPYRLSWYYWYLSEHFLSDQVTDILPPKLYGKFWQPWMTSSGPKIWTASLQKLIPTAPGPWISMVSDAVITLFIP